MKGKKMDKNIFRQKNIDKINSPESLNDYVKVTNPSIWMVLIGIILLIIGALTFGALTTVDTKVSAVSLVEDGKITAYVDEKEIDKISGGMPVKIEGASFVIGEISKRPQKSEEIDDYVLHVGGMEETAWVYTVSIVGDMEDGIYPASIIIDKVSPLSYVFN